jgi:hypothetical protein
MPEKRAEKERWILDCYMYQIEHRSKIAPAKPARAIAVSVSKINSF